MQREGGKEKREEEERLIERKQINELRKIKGQNKFKSLRELPLLYTLRGGKINRKKTNK